jgi:hypothetical protein
MNRRESMKSRIKAARYEVTYYVTFSPFNLRLERPP